MNDKEPTGNEAQDAGKSLAGPGAGAVAFPDRERALSAEEFRHLADVAPAVEWFANISNPRTRRAYRLDLEDFSKFAGIQRPEEFRLVVRAHVIAWRNTLEERNLSPATIRRKLAALSAIFNHLCESNAVLSNPTRGVKRPAASAHEGKTPFIRSGPPRRPTPWITRRTSPRCRSGSAMPTSRPPASMTAGGRGRRTARRLRWRTDALFGPSGRSPARDHPG